jgi:outer membrane protein
LIAVLVFVASTSGAQTTRLTLEQAQARALEASHRLAEARAREAAAIAGVAAREAAQRPLLSMSGGYTRTNHVTPFLVPGPGPIGVPRVIYPDVPNNYHSRLDLQWPIYTGGRDDALERAARAEAGAVAADVATARADLRQEVARAFWAVVTARAATTVLERSLERANAHLRDVRARFETGILPPNDVSSAEAQESRQRMLLIEARNQHDVALADLARLVNAVPGDPIEPNASLDVAPALTASLEALVAEARASRTDRLSLERRIASADEQRQAVAAGRRPTVSLGAGVDYARPNPRIFPRVDRWEESWDVGVNVNWSLWDGGRTAAAVAQASAVAAAGRERLAEFDSVLAVELRQRALEIDSGRAAVAAADDGIRAATEARRVVGERYTSGVIAQTEVLDADVALLQAELDRTRALSSLRVAEARLARGLGR